MSDKNTKSNIKLAVFDVDGTLSSGVLSLAFLQELVQRKLFSSQVYQSLRNLEKDYALEKMSREVMSEKWLATYLQEMAGKDPEHHLSAAEHVWEQSKANAFSFVSPLLDKLTEKGYTNLVISASPREIVKHFCETYNFSPERFRATTVKVSDSGKYMAETDVILSLAKHKLVQLNSLAESLFPDQEINWKESIAMGDSYSDVEMLRATGRPVVMQESGRKANDLVGIAMENNWTIVDEKNAFDKILDLIK